jgi:hypothetical protein
VAASCNIPDRDINVLIQVSPVVSGNESSCFRIAHYLRRWVVLGIVESVVYPGLLVVGLYVIGRRLVASKRAMVTMLLVASVVGEIVSPFLNLLTSNELPVPPSAIWSMPLEDVASLLSPVLYSILFFAPVTFFLAIGALALPNWLKTPKQK